VYSLQPTVLQDLNTLTDVCREIATAHAQDDPLECGGQWGMIQNRNVKVRLSFKQSFNDLMNAILTITDIATDWSAPPSPSTKDKVRTDGP
jgi:hypothetical protein